MCVHKFIFRIHPEAPGPAYTDGVRAPARCLIHGNNTTYLNLHNIYYVQTYTTYLYVKLRSLHIYTCVIILLSRRSFPIPITVCIYIYIYIRFPCRLFNPPAQTHAMTSPAASYINPKNEETCVYISSGWFEGDAVRLLFLKIF